MHELSVNKLSPLTATAFQGTNTGKLTNDIETICGKTIDILSKEKVLAGDVITIDKMFRRITKFGRLFAWSRGYDAMGADVCSVSSA